MSRKSERGATAIGCALFGALIGSLATGNARSAFWAGKTLSYQPLVSTGSYNGTSLKLTTYQFTDGTLVQIHQDSPSAAFIKMEVTDPVNNQKFEYTFDSSGTLTEVDVRTYLGPNFTGNVQEIGSSTALSSMSNGVPTSQANWLTDNNGNVFTSSYTSPTAIFLNQATAAALDIGYFATNPRP